MIIEVFGVFLNPDNILWLWQDATNDVGIEFMADKSNDDLIIEGRTKQEIKDEINKKIAIESAKIEHQKQAVITQLENI